MIPRLLLVTAALILAAGGVLHALAFPKALAVIDATHMPDFYAHSLQALWLIDSAALFSLAIAYLVIAARPALASGAVVMLLALVPAATAGLVYYFVGAFFPAHSLAAAALLVVIAGLRFGDTAGAIPTGTPTP